MSSENVRSLESCLKALVEEFSEILEWKWDGRFGTALAEFSSDKTIEVQGILEQILDSDWDHSNLKEAPDSVQAIARKLGGLMHGQRLLISDPDLANCVFCAWWPWGNGTKISIRIGIFSSHLPGEGASQWTFSLRDVFKI
jgi:hypothetical protein